MNKMRQCYKCKQIKSNSDFTTDRSRKDGLAYGCKDCQREYNVKRWKEYKEKYLPRIDNRRNWDYTDEQLLRDVFTHIDTNIWELAERLKRTLGAVYQKAHNIGLCRPREHSDAWNKKVSIAKKGFVMPEEAKQKISIANTGNRHTLEWRRQHSERMTGPNNPNWKGGKTFEEYNFEFDVLLKNEVRERDNYMCQLCGYVHRGSHVHHIDYDKQNNNLSNLISLCNSCHSKTNFNREYWTNYCSNIINGGGRYITMVY